MRRGFIFGIILLFFSGSFLPTSNGEIKKEDAFKQGVATLTNTNTITKALMNGQIANISYMGKFVLFDAIKLKVITFFPFSINTYFSGKFAILDYIGPLWEKFTFIFCTMIPYKSIQMIVQTKTPANHSVTWMVVSTSGNIATNEILWTLTDESGNNLTGTHFKIYDNISFGLLNTGDTIEVRASSSGLYRITIKDKNTALIMCSLNEVYL